MADITLNNIQTQAGSSLSYTPSSVTDSCLCVVVGNTDLDQPTTPNPVTGIDFGATAMTLVIDKKAIVGPFDAQQQAAIYILLSPGTSAETISINGGQSGRLAFIVCTLDQVNQSTPTGDTDGVSDDDNTTGLTPSVTTTQDSSAVISGYSTGEDTPLSCSGGTIGAALQSEGIGIASSITTTSPEVDSHAWTHGTRNRAVGIAVEFINTSVGGAGIIIDTEPATVKRATQNTITISGASVTPTAGNTSMKINGSTGIAITVDAVTSVGGDVYDIDFTVSDSVGIQYDRTTGYTYYITTSAENIESSTIPFIPITGYNYTDLVSPVYADNTSVLFGYTGDTPVTGDQVEWPTTTSPSSIIISAISATGIITWDTSPIITQTISRRVIQVDGTIGTSTDYTFIIDEETPPLEPLGNSLECYMKLKSNLLFTVGS